MKTVKEFSMGVKRVRLDCRVCGSNMRDPTNVAQMAKSLLGKEKKARFLVFFLGYSGEVLGYSETHQGCQDQVTVEPIESFRSAVLLSCRSVIFAHNHPKGGEVSQYDIDLTKSFIAAGTTLNIQVLDHLLVAGNEVTSIFPYLTNEQPPPKKKRRRRR